MANIKIVASIGDIDSTALAQMGARLAEIRAAYARSGAGVGND